jgi:DNA-binding transcriptional LysR family regulator
MVNLEWYRSFVAVIRVGTVSGAAQSLHLTQPAVSQHIAALESALGHPLFVRMPRRMLPTAEGKSLYTQVAASIEQLESISTRSIATDAPQLIRLGTPPEFFAEQFLTRLPQSENLRYRVKFGLVEDLIEQLISGQLDVAIATQKIAKPDLEYQLIAEEKFWLVAPPQLVIPILSEDLSKLEQWIKTQPLIAYSEELPIIRRFWRVVFGRRLDLTPTLILPDLRMICQAVSAGFGFSVLPDYLCAEMVKAHHLTLVLDPTNAIKNQIWLAYKKSEKQSPQVTLLLDLVADRSE